MTIKTLTAAAAIVLTATLGSTSVAFAKAHDMGAADGTPPPAGTTAGTVEAIDGPGVSALFQNGARGAAASANGSDNAVDPVVGNGANQPD